MEGKKLVPLAMKPMKKITSRKLTMAAMSGISSLFEKKKKKKFLSFVDLMKVTLLTCFIYTSTLHGNGNGN